uniref:(northern house mosquito) hypothetical protein n=1 Tax=Culex pipiens TaxID=7175 RepID=A0A8D8BDD5_CULPI
MSFLFVATEVASCCIVALPLQAWMKNSFGLSLRVVFVSTRSTTSCSKLYRLSYAWIRSLVSPWLMTITSRQEYLLKSFSATVLKCLVTLVNFLLRMSYFSSSYP